MADTQLIATINALLAHESCSMMQRLVESEPFIPPNAADEATEILAMAEAESKHGEGLVALLDKLDTTPGPRGVQIEAGEMQFNAVHALLPRLIDDKRRLIAAYESALDQAKDTPVASDTLGILLNDHRSQLQRLEELAKTATA